MPPATRPGQRTISGVVVRKRACCVLDVDVTRLHKDDEHVQFVPVRKERAAQSTPTFLVECGNSACQLLNNKNIFISHLLFICRSPVCHLHLVTEIEGESRRLCRASCCVRNSNDVISTIRMERATAKHCLADGKEHPTGLHVLPNLSSIWSTYFPFV